MDNSGEESDIETELDNEKDDFNKNFRKPQLDYESDSDSENEKPREKSELELLREKNIKERDAFLAMLMNDPEYADVVATANELKKTRTRTVTRTTDKDPSFQIRSHTLIPLERRRSSRLQNIPPVFFKEDLIDDTEVSRKRKRSQEYDYYDLETVIYRPKKSRESTQGASRCPIIPVEEVTEAMIANIARRGTIKTYSESGTSCHQCRQKTKDQKSCCRNANCVGIRGQFCGVCLENRYGEDVAVVLKDPVWKCPVCRGICNCSFCRQKAGKRPTGILAPLAQQNGHKSVKDFLESLKGEGDFPHQDKMWQKVNNPKYLLGFSEDLKFACMGGNIKHKIDYFLSSEGLNESIKKLVSKLESDVELHGEPNLLGFYKETGVALLDDGTRCDMDPASWKTNTTEGNEKEILDTVPMNHVAKKNL